MDPERLAQDVSREHFQPIIIDVSYPFGPVGLDVSKLRYFRRFVNYPKTTQVVLR